MLMDFGSGFNDWRGGSDMSFFDRLFGKKNSAESAKERLQLVLIHDRTDLTPAELDSLKDDLIATISRHVEIDAQAMQIGVEHDGRSQRLVADIPLKAARRQRARKSAK
jgi:cell division topological specificity factor